MADKPKVKQSRFARWRDKRRDRRERRRKATSTTACATCTNATAISPAIIRNRSTNGHGISGRRPPGVNNTGALGAGALLNKPSDRSPSLWS